VLGLEVGQDQPAKRPGLRGLGLLRLGNGADGLAFCEEFGRPQRCLLQIDLVARDAVVAPYPPVTILEDLEPFDAHLGHHSRPRMSSRVSITSPDFTVSIH